MSFTFIANSYFVDPSKADDTGSGRTEANAKKTLAAVMLLVPPAGSTIFLAGGTHTVATATTISIPDGVNLVGSGSHNTIILGDPDDPNNSIIEVNGNNRLESLQVKVTATGEGLQTKTGGIACDLEIIDCHFDAVDDNISLNSLASGRHNVRIKISTFNLANVGITLSNIAADVSLENCIGTGTNKFVNARQTSTVDQTISLKDCVVQNSGGSATHEAIELYASSTGTISLSLEGCKFHPGGGVAIRSTQTSTGTVKIYDNGGNNLTLDNMDLSLGGVLIDEHRSNVLIKGVTTMASSGTIASTVLDGYFADSLVGSIVRILSGTYAGTTREIRANSDLTDTISVFPNFPGVLSSGDQFEILPTITQFTTGNIDAITDAILDENLSTHTIANSIGTILKDQVTRAEILVSGTVGSIGTVSVIITGGSTVDDYYKNCLIVIDTGAGAKQARYIKSYDGTSKVAIYDIPLTVTTDVASTFIVYNIMSPDVENVKTLLGSAAGVSVSADIASIKNDTGTVGVQLKATQTSTWASNLVKSAGIMKAGTASAGGTTTSLVDTSLTDVENTYKDRIVMFLTGSLKGQAASISAYAAGTKTFTISAVTTAPILGDTYIII